MLLDTAKVEERYPGIMEEYRNKIHEKVRELLEDSQIDEGRLAAEVVLYADKICTDDGNRPPEKPYRKHGLPNLRKAEA